VGTGLSPAEGYPFVRGLPIKAVRRAVHPGRAVKRAVTPKVVKKASRAMHLLPHRGVSRDTIHGSWRKNRYVGMVFKSWDEHDILRPQVAACPRGSDQLDGFVALRTMIAVSGVLTAKAVTHLYHFQRPHRR